MRSSIPLISFGLVLSFGLAGCSDTDETALVRPLEPPSPGDPEGALAAPEQPGAAPRYVLGSITIDADGNRVSYAQVVGALEGDFTNQNGIEAQGNAVFMAHGSDFFYGLAESPEWVRYSTEGGFQETGRLSFLNYGVTYMDFANVIVDDDTAVSVLTQEYVAIVWSPRTMEVRGTIELGHLRKEGLELEAFTVTTHDGLVYVPGKWVNWEQPTVLQEVSMTILDPHSLEVLAVATDDRCGAGGRVVFDARGYGYVMGDGRNQSMQVFAGANEQPTVNNCLLRIAPGGSDFEQSYYFEIPALTGGLDSMTELEAADPDSGVAFSMMSYPERVPPGLERVNFEHWDVPAYKMWRIQLGDQPSAEQVQGSNFTVVGFSGSAVDGKLYSPESADGAESSVYEVDPVTNTAVLKFTMDGYFAGLLPLSP
jgi:hypothetical protein